MHCIGLGGYDKGVHQSLGNNLPKNFCKDIVEISEPIPLKCWPPHDKNSTLMRYINSFVTLASQVEGLTNQQYLGYFQSGLGNEIWVHSHEAVDLVRIMSIACEIEMETQFLLSHKINQPTENSGLHWNSGCLLKQTPSPPLKTLTHLPQQQPTLISQTTLNCQHLDLLIDTQIHP